MSRSIHRSATGRVPTTIGNAANAGPQPVLPVGYGVLESDLKPDPPPQSETRPRGTPPMPSAMSSESEPVEIASRSARLRSRMRGRSACGTLPWNCCGPNAESALASEPTEENYRHLIEIQSQLQSVQATEALIEGFGTGSGRAARN